MDEKLLFESKGWSKGKQVTFIVLGLIMIIFAIMFLQIVGEKGRMSRMIYGTREEEILNWVVFGFFMVLGILYICISILSMKSYLRIYEGHVEGKNFDIIHLLIGGSGSTTSNIFLRFDEIKGVTSRNGTLVIETLGKPKKIFCKDSSTAERIILEKMRTYSQH